MIKMDFLPTKSSRFKCALLIVLLIGIFVIENSGLDDIIGSQVFNNILKPLLWFGVACIVWLFPNVGRKAKLKQLSSINGWAFIFAFIFVTASFIIGVFVDGLGKSPYNHSVTGILFNMLIVGTALVGREFVRSYLVNSMTKDENYIIFIVITMFMTSTTISLNGIINQDGYKEVMTYIAQYIVPEFSHNLLATYLVFLGGPVPSIIYLGIIKGFHWFSPILPNLQWLTAALVGVLCPVFSLTAMQNIYLSESRQLKAKDKDEESLFSWIVTSLFSIGIIWFAVGVFPIYPSVIATGSMEPMIKPGDVILVKKITDMEGIDGLNVGDVMQFKRGSILISHRIIEAVEEEDVKKYRTKGDNNSRADVELVKPEDVKGTIVYVVPKIGWPTLLMKSRGNDPEKVTF